MKNRTCSLPGCSKPHRARGLCTQHWKQEYGKPATYAITCETCSAEYLSSRKAGRFCSGLCHDVSRNGGQPTMSVLPRMHPVVRLSAGLSARRVARVVAKVRAVDCEWCGTQFATRKASQRMCSPSCKRKAQRVRRRGQAKGWVSHYTWTEVMRLFLTLDRCCAYCHEPIDGQPDPDHVVPLSRGGSNSITNVLPCCQSCNSDKRDLLLSEWNQDRSRRGLPDRTTADPRWIHLTSVSHAA